jgi:REP element-mobilizing transposase RayT
MVAGYHLIWSVYGSWLPNDPRGSSSHEIRIPEIEALGELHRGRKIIQPNSAEIRRFYEEARKVLKHELLTLDADDIQVVAHSFAQVIQERRYTAYACAIMPDHVHMLIRKHRFRAEQMIEHMQEASRQALVAAERRPGAHPVWGGPGWKVFLETQDDFERTIDYIRKNPSKIGWPVQAWPFVTAYDGWLPFVPYWWRAKP